MNKLKMLTLLFLLSSCQNQAWQEIPVSVNCESDQVKNVVENYFEDYLYCSEAEDYQIDVYYSDDVQCGFLGKCYWSSSLSYVEIALHSKIKNRRFEKAVIAHELGHALGHFHHSDDSDCIMFDRIYTTESYFDLRKRMSCLYDFLNELYTKQ